MFSIEFFLEKEREIFSFIDFNCVEVDVNFNLDFVDLVFFSVLGGEFFNFWKYKFVEEDLKF